MCSLHPYGYQPANLCFVSCIHIVCGLHSYSFQLSNTHYNILPCTLIKFRLSIAFLSCHINSLQKELLYLYFWITFVKPPNIIVKSMNGGFVEGVLDMFVTKEAE